MTVHDDLAVASRQSFGQEHGDPFAAAVRRSRMPMAFADPRLPDCPIVFVNEAFSRMTGYELDDAVGRNCRFLQGPGTDAEAVKIIAESLQAHQPIGIDILNYRKDGTPFWNALYISPVFNDAGELVYFFSSQFDATERRRNALAVAERKAQLETELEAGTRDLTKTLHSLQQALQEKTLLIHEIDHRVKNNLQTISTLINLQMRGETEPAVVSALKSLHDRVDAMGTVHRRLNTNETIGVFDFANLVNELVPEIVRAGKTGQIHTDLDVEAVSLNTSFATPVSLILNELVTNAIKHAWPAGQTGKLTVKGTVDNGQLLITIADDGRGMPEQRPSRALSGWKLTEALVRQIRGTIAQQSSDRGTIVRIGFPLP